MNCFWQHSLHIVYILCIYFTSTVKSGRFAEYQRNVTHILKTLLDEYDVKLRPNFGGNPCNIEIHVTTASFQSVSSVNMDFTITLDLYQNWKDDRLSFGNKDALITLPSDFVDNIWVPGTVFVNGKHSSIHDVTASNKLFRLYGDGSVTYGTRITTTLKCSMNLLYYPHDSQNCSIEFESYVYTENDVYLDWDDTPIVGFEYLTLQQFTIVGHNTFARTVNLTNGKYRRLGITFVLSRNLAYFIFETFLPSNLIVMLSWVSFYINHEIAPARIAIGITTVLNIVMISSGLKSSLPRIYYVKAIDIYLITCFVFVFLAIMEYAAVNHIMLIQKNKRLAAKKRQMENLIMVKPTANADPGPSNGTPAKHVLLQIEPGQKREIVELGKNTYPLSTSPIKRKRIEQWKNRFRQSQFAKSLRLRPHWKPYPAVVVNKPSYKNRFIASFREKKRDLRESLPLITDFNINMIDQYSRIIFPTSFLIFNILYWTICNF